MFGQIVTSRAPVRIDFFGGWTDLPLFTELIPGLVINAGITLYTYATVNPAPGNPVSICEYGYSTSRVFPKAGIYMYSEDLDVWTKARYISEVEYDGTLDLVKAACMKLGIKTTPGLEIRTRSEAPPGSGLGTSASLGVAVVGALAKYIGKNPLPNEIADLAYRLEAEELELLTGTQDQYAATYGGMSMWQCKGEDVSYFPIRMSRDMELDLEKRCALVYTGQSRLSSDVHRHVRKAFVEKVNHGAIEGLVEVTKQAADLLYKNDLDGFGTLLTRNWEFQKQLHEGVTNSDIDRYFDIALEKGALGGKACGAGGGGCLLFFAEKGKDYMLRRALKEEGLEILDFHIDHSGLCVWV